MNQEPTIQAAMHHPSLLRAPGQARRLLAPLGCVLALALPGAAQGPRVVVSTSDDVAAAAGVPFSVHDGDLVMVEPGQPVAPFFAGGHFQACAGFVPGDIDAFAFLPGSQPGSAGALVFSLLSNEGGFLDGDLLVLAHGGGAGLLISEASLAGALGASGSNIDVDALAYDDQGRILFSLTDNLTSSAIGAVLDGDILRLEPGFAAVTRLFSEADVQAQFAQATGLGDAIGDVQALEWVAGEVWIAVQSPSRHDGSVIALGAAPRVVVDETGLGLGGAELDALALPRAGDENPVFHISTELALPGDPLHVEAHGRPGGALLVLMSGRAGFLDFSRFGGFGAWYLERTDPWLMALSAAHALPVVLLDGAGHYAVDWNLPPGAEFGLGLAGEQGWSFQVFDVAARRLSAPFRVQKL